MGCEYWRRGPRASGLAHAQSYAWCRWALGAVGSATGRAEHRYQRLVRIAAQCIIGLNDANIGATALALVSLFAPISCFALVAFLALVTFGTSHPLRTGGTGGALRTCRTLRSLLTFRTWIAATCRQCKRNPQNQYWNESHGLPSQPSFYAGRDAKPAHVDPSRDIAAECACASAAFGCCVFGSSSCGHPSAASRLLRAALPCDHNHGDCDIIHRDPSRSDACDQPRLPYYLSLPRAVQALINLLGVLRLIPPGAEQGRGTMTTISVVSAYPTVAMVDRSLTAITLFCCCGLTATFGALTFGIDLAAAWV